MLGGFLALCSAASFAFNNASVRRAVLTGSIVQGMAITVPLGVPLFFLAALVTGNLAAVLGFSPTALAALSAAGIMHFVWGRYCNYRATRAMGTNLVAPVQQLNLLVTLVLAIWLLGEYLTPLKILGIALILLGPTFTMQKTKKPAHEQDAERAVSDEKITPIDAEKPAAFQPKYAEGYTFSLLSATGYGLSPVLIRIGLENQGVGVALAGGLVAYIAATALFAIMMLWPGQWKHVWSTDREAAKWFTFSGFLVFFSQMFLYMAMSVAPVTVVSPINRLSILFRLYFSRLLNPQHEVFGGGVVLATVVSLAGAVLVSLSTDLVQSLLPLPEGVVTLLNWRWP
jgi:drug/metabolite transporter (DMT)-like permease